MEKRLSQSNKGFTLVEICVTLVIFSILASIVAFNLISWQEYSTNMSQDENAELVYMAFRNKVAILKANNVIDVDAYTSTTEYYYCKKGDYKNYKKDSSKVSANTKTLFDYIIPYIYDKKMLDAYIVVEVSGGNIKTVLYSDRCDFVDKNLSSTNNTKYLKYKTDSNERYDKSVGIYSNE